MHAKAFLFAWGISAGLAIGDGVGGPPHKAVRPKPKLIDLDFSDDDDDLAAGHQASRGGGLRAAFPPWIYWALGATAVTAGVGLYLLEEKANGPTVTRKEQVFSDERQ